MSSLVTEPTDTSLHMIRGEAYGRERDRVPSSRSCSKTSDLGNNFEALSSLSFQPIHSLIVSSKPAILVEVNGR